MGEPSFSGYTLRDIEVKVSELLGDKYLLVEGPRGLSGSRVAFGVSPKQVFVKWAEPEFAGVVRKEAANLMLVAEAKVAPALLAYDEGIPLIVMEMVHADPAGVWNESTWLAACEILVRLRETPVSGLPHISELDFFQDRGPHFFDILFKAVDNDMSLATYLSQSYNKIRFWGRNEYVGDNFLCHSDTHDGNWMFAENRMPVLIDFEHLHIGPAGFDESFLLAHLAEVPLLEKLAWIESAKINSDVLRTTVAACAARLACGLESDFLEWREWCTQRWGTALNLARILK